MRKLVALLAGLAVLGFVNYGIYQREQVLTHGRVVLLKLAPVDPRSLMQGDYMRLRFAIADEAFPFNRRGPRLADGTIVVALDDKGVGHFRRFGDARPRAPNEIALRYRVRAGEPKFATDAYFFEEGTASTYDKAAYGAFRVGPDGDMILTDLRGAGYEVLGPKR